MRKEKLSSLCKISNGYAFKSDDYVDHGHRVMRITNVQKGFVVDDNPKFIPNEIADNAYNFKLSTGDILVSLTGNVGRVGMVLKQHLPAVLNQRVGLIRPISPEINKKYLFQFLNSEKFEREAIQNSNGVAQLNLSSKWIESYEIPLPPLDDQIRIAHLLGKVEGVIAQRKQHLQQIDDLLKSIFLEMFGDTVQNDKGWKKKQMGTIMSIVRGGSPRPIDKFLGGAYPWIKIGDATSGDDIYINSTKEHIIEAGLKKTRLLPAGSLIFANCGVSLGFARIITFEGCIHDGWLAFFDIDEKSLNKIFILKALNQITPYFRNLAPDGTQPNLNTSIMKRFELICPPINLQNQFASIVEKAEGIKSSYQKSLADLEVLYSALSQKAFKGELDLSRVPLLASLSHNNNHSDD